MSKKGLTPVLTFLFITTTILILSNSNLQIWFWLPDSLIYYKRYFEQGITYLLLMVIATIAMKVEGITTKRLGISRLDILYSIPVLLTLLTGHILLASQEGGWGKILQRANISMLIPTVIMNLIIIGFSEEYIYRGYVQNAFMIHCGVIKALVFSSLSFAIAHLPLNLDSIMNFSTLWNIAQSSIFSLLSPLLVSLLVLSMAYYVTENLMIPIYIHGFYNLTIKYFAPTNLSFFLFWLLVAPSVVAYCVYFHKTRIILKSFKRFINPEKKHTDGSL